MSLSSRKNTPDRPEAPEGQPAPPRQRGVLLINTGTPEGPEALQVRKYLREFLSDPMVIRLPSGLGWFQGTLGWLIARFRAEHSAELYRKIWTDRGSPLKFIMEDQASALELALPAGWRTFVAMRYGKPTIAESLREIEEAGIEELVVVPMYPQFSRTTTGTVVQETYRALGAMGEHINVATRATWYDDVGYINAQARLVAEFASNNDLTPRDSYLLFSAHGLPVSYVQRGDPYVRHVERSVQLVTQRLGWPEDRLSLSFQSRLGPTEWLKPDTDERLAELAEAGEKRVLVCPISFTVDCLETLEEIQVRYRGNFEVDNRRLFLCPALNTYDPFISALKNLVLRGSQPMTSWGADTAPLISAEPEDLPADGDLKSLVMIGTSLENRVGPGRGPRLRFSGADDLCCIKKPHDQVHGFLQRVREEGTATEALVWNTCHRFEFYGWLQHPDDAADRECVIARIRHQLFGNEPDGLGVNVLFGADAWHHLMRTAVGLNSGLPGDRDVVEQFQTACRTAEAASMSGPRVQHLLAATEALARELRDRTRWGRFAPGYCYASLSRIWENTGLDPAQCRHVVIGGSTTSHSVLTTLFSAFDVPRRQMTLIYRGHHGGQMKRLRSAIGNGNRIRVNSYSEDAVVKALADADVVYFGIDRSEPVLAAEQLAGIRDLASRPLTIIDFNTFGSLRMDSPCDSVSMWTAQRLEEEVSAFAESMCRGELFDTAVEEAESWIEKRLPAAAAPYLQLPCTQRGHVRRATCDSCWIKPEHAIIGSDTI